jgi:hypothetical protein
MPGFGPLDYSEGELAALVDRIVGGLRKSVDALPKRSVEPADTSRELGQAATPSVDVTAEASAAAQLAPVPAATQPAVAESAESVHEPVRRRTHGGALPR